MRKYGLIVLLLAMVPAALAFAATSGPSPIPPPPNFQISTTQMALCRGMVNYVPIAITNNVTMEGGAALDSLSLAIAGSKSAFSVGSGAVSTVSAINPNTTTMVKMPIFVSVNASSLITRGIGVNYDYYALYTDSEVRNITFEVESCPSTLNISASPGTLTSGRIENLKMVFANQGSTPLRELSVHTSFPSQDATLLAVQPISISSLAPGASVELNESVFVSRNASQSFPLNISISLFNGTVPEQIAYSQIMLASGLINMSASSVTLTPTSPAPGGIFSISFVLTDLGTVGASAVSATVLPGSGFVPFGSNSVFIGDMQTDSQTPLTLTLTASNTIKAGSYTIPVEINYLDNLREAKNTVIDVPVTVAGGALAYNSLAAAAYARRAGGGRSVYYAIIAILTIALIAVTVLFLGERKRGKK